MEGLTLTLAMYRAVAGRAAELSLRSWPVCATVFVYLVLFGVAGVLLAPLGLLGGIVFALVRAACIGSFLYLVEQIVRGSRLTLSDFGRSFQVYLWDVVGVFFLFWIVSMVLIPVVSAHPQGLAILVSVQLVVFVFFNAVPELIYLGHHSLFELLTESYSFITENWIEWFPPNLLLAAGAWLLLSFDMPGWAGPLRLAVLSLYVYFAMVARGLLFVELTSGSRRARLFRHRART